MTEIYNAVSIETLFRGMHEISGNYLSSSYYNVTAIITDDFGNYRERTMTMKDFLSMMTANQLIKNGYDRTFIVSILNKLGCNADAFPTNADEHICVVRDRDSDYHPECI